MSSGERSREVILDSAERLMAAHGYAGTAISQVRAESGLPASSIYWHFGSKQGLLAAVMKRGADRWFAAIPEWEQLDVPEGQRFRTMLTVGALAVKQHPEFLRLFYLLSLERHEDEAVTALIEEVRGQAIARFRDALAHLVPDDVPTAAARRVIDELAAFGVALSDGAFFADHVEPDSADVERLFDQLGNAVVALLPSMLER